MSEMRNARTQNSTWWPVRETPALVGIVNRRKDWELLQTAHWYRIPVRSAPAELPDVKYLAFYLTRAFGDEKYAVSCYAPVLELARVRRIDLLPDEPQHRRSCEEYYRIDLGELQRLSRPIPSVRLRRIVFIPTTLERLRRAQEINDLFCSSPIEDRLYAEMKEANLQPERQFLVREEGVGYMLDLALFCAGGQLNVECDGERYHAGKVRAEEDRARDNALTAAGWRVLRFSGREINQDPAKCLRTVRRTVRRLGGTSSPADPGRKRRRTE